MKTILIAITAACMVSCAQTVIYRDGKPIARFQGDMKGVRYRDGDTEFSADAVDHSTATTAQKAGAQSIVTAAGAAIAVSGLTSIIR